MRVTVLGGGRFIGPAIIEELGGSGHEVVMVLAAAGSDAELVHVADDAVPDDLSLTRSFAQHLLVASARARDLLGFRDTPPDEALGHSVRWHLAHPPPDPSPDFSADDQALALGRQAGDAPR